MRCGFKKPKSNDTIIHVGDIGIVWDQPNEISNEEKYLKKWYTSKPYRLITCGGNHENWERVFKLPLVYVNWLGGYAYEYIKNKVYYAKRGIVYTIDNATYLFAGGAFSEDSKYRIDGLSWWKDLEEMSMAEMDECRSVLKLLNYKVDYVITHTGPRDVLNLFGFFGTDLTSSFLDSLIYDGLKFKQWYFGHLHIDKSYNNFNCTYNEIRKINEKV